jgi:hypothetical protein
MWATDLFKKPQENKVATISTMTNLILCKESKGIF